MTIEQFRASKKEVADLGAELDNEDLAGRAGYLYCESAYIEKAEDGTLSLLIERTEYVGEPQSELEWRLFVWCAQAGVLEMAY